MSPSERESQGREPERDELDRAREGTLGGAGERHGSEHPAPPAEGKWRGVLAQVRGLLAGGRRSRSDS